MSGKAKGAGNLPPEPRPVAAATRRFTDAQVARSIEGGIARKVAMANWDALNPEPPASDDAHKSWQAKRANFSTRLLTASDHGGFSPAHERALWEAVHEALQAYARSPQESFPVEIASFIAGALGDLLHTGKFPETLKKIAKGRSGAHSLSLDQDRIAAVCYARAVDTGSLVDPNPIPVLATLFRVTEKAIWEWKREHENAPLPPLATRGDRSLFNVVLVSSVRHWNAFRFNGAYSGVVEIDLDDMTKRWQQLDTFRIQHDP